MFKSVVLTAAAAWLALAGLSGTVRAGQAFTIDDGLAMVRIDDVAMTPDGGHVFYSLSELVWTENDWKKRYFLSSADGERTTQFIGEAGGERFAFSPDGGYLAFLRKTGDGGEDGGEERSQIFVMPVTGGEAVQLTDHPGTITDFKWAGGGAVVFVAEETFDAETEKEIRLGADPVFVDEAPNGKNAARFSNFWRAARAGGAAERLTDEKHVIEDFDVSPDGGNIAFVARPDTRTNYVHEAELFIVDAARKRVRRMTDNAAPESAPMWSPDGTRLAYRAPSDKTFELRAGYFWIMDPQSGETRRLDGQNTGELTGAAAWSADGRALLYNEIHGTNTNLYRIDAASGAAQAMTDRAGTLRALGFSKDRSRMVFSFSDFTTPADIYVSGLDGAGPARITDANPWIASDRRLSDGELVRWTSKGGMEIEGVYYPPARKRRGKAPMILNIHGGPAGVIENTFRTDFQILAGEGYAVLAPNFRGSTGGGDGLLRGLMGEVGDGEFIDLMTGVDHVIAERNVDPRRLGVRGWSWGGVSASYVVTQTDRFRAASIGAMVGDWATETGPGFNFDVSLWYIGGTPWDAPEEWAKRSSLTHVKNVVTPSILFHGAADETSSTGQSLMFFTALRDIGKAPVRYIKFPRQGHGVEEPRLRRIYEANEIQWFKTHIDGEDWEIPPFPAEGRNDQQ